MQQMTISRRRMLAALTTALPFGGCSLFSEKNVSHLSTHHETELSVVLAKMLDSQLRYSPETATRLGLDNGNHAALRFQLDERSGPASQRFLQEQRVLLEQLKAVDRTQLGRMGRHNLDAVLYQRQSLLEGAERFQFGAIGDSEPYVLTQLTGAYQSVPDFLQNRHPVESLDDAHAYLSRLEAFGVALDHEVERAQTDAANGVIPPDFVIDTAIAQLQAVCQTDVRSSALVVSLSRRADAKQLPGDWASRALELVRDRVYPALSRQIELLRGWRQNASHVAGVWRLPDGDAYYRQALRLQTTTQLSAEEIHRIGNDQVRELKEEMDGLLRQQGLHSGSVTQRLLALAEDQRFIYPNTEAGRDQLLADLDAKVQSVKVRLPAFFDRLPRAGLQIRRVPPTVEAGAPRGYYQAGTSDGHVPGAFYVNLRNTAEWTRWYLPTFAFHEGIPGHHLQGSLEMEAQGLAPIRKTLWFAGYGEGWALYAEQLAVELGAYEDDPFGRLGYLQSMLFRAARLVADTGLHALRWDLERTVDYMVNTVGEARSRMVTEVARYCVVPGQALSYKVGHNRWNELRESARRQLGSQFDLRRFHTAGLMCGGLPLDVLSRAIDEWVVQERDRPSPRTT